MLKVKKVKGELMELEELVLKVRKENPVVEVMPLLVQEEELLIYVKLNMIVLMFH